MDKLVRQIILAFCTLVGLLTWQFPHAAQAQVLPKLASQTTPEDAKRACEAGDGRECAIYGYFLMARRSNPNLSEAVTYFALSCRLNSGLGCFSLGSFQEMGMGTTATTQEALANLEKSCTLNYDDGCIHLGFKYYRGQGVNEDKLKAIGYFGQACTQDRVRGCIYHRQLALLQNANSVQPMRTEIAPIIRGSREQNEAVENWANQRYSAAFPKLSNICERLRNYTCLLVGQSYFEGLGVAQDMRKAADYFERACQGGIGAGCNGLGNAFSHGEGRDKDSAAAVGNYTRACEMGTIDACFNLGVSNYLGESMPKNLKMAVELFYDACTQRHINACFNLASIYMQEDDNNDKSIAKTALERVLGFEPTNERARAALTSLQAGQ